MIEDKPNDEIKEIDGTKGFYLCSPLLNTECMKENCYINNGPCCHTVNKKYSQQHLLDYITNLQQYYYNNVNKYEKLIEKYSNLQQENQKNKKIIEDVYNYLDEKKDVPEWWDTDFFTCMNMLSDGKLTFNDWVKKGDDKNV